MLNRTIARPGAIATVAFVTLALGLIAARPAVAQFLPAVLYGAGLTPGQNVEASINGKACASTTATPKGEWLMQIPVNAPCGPEAGAAIAFTVDGEPAIAIPPATWESGGIPTASIGTGYSLTNTDGRPFGGAVGAGGEDDEDSGSSPVLFIVIGIVVLAAVAGGGAYLYRRRATS